MNNNLLQVNRLGFRVKNFEQYVLEEYKSQKDSQQECFDYVWGSLMADFNGEYDAVAQKFYVAGEFVNEEQVIEYIKTLIKEWVVDNFDIVGSSFENVVCDVYHRLKSNIKPTTIEAPIEIQQL